MIRFDRLERLGEYVAVMSDKANGDCSSNLFCRTEREQFLLQAEIPPNHLIRVRQAHGTIVHSITSTFLENYSSGDPNLWPEGDGLITNLSGFAIGVSVADCVPLLIVDPFKEAIGAFHAGRKGTVAGLANTAVISMVNAFNSKPQNLHCVIGPSAGPCCYEVSPDMAERLLKQGFPVEGQSFDLWEANRRFLVEAGVPESQIERTGWCTICGGGFHSYRADHSTQRNLAVIMLKEFL